MGTVHPALDETERDKLVALVNDHIAAIKAGDVTGFIWTVDEELMEWDSIRAALEEA